MSNAGLDLICICQSPVMRLMLKFWSLGSLKVARPSGVDDDPDPIVEDIGTLTGSAELGATEFFPSLQATMAVAITKAQTRLPRTNHIEASNRLGMVWQRPRGHHMLVRP